MATGESHMAVWTEEGEAYFGNGGYDKLGHGEQNDGPVSRPIQANVIGKRLVGASQGIHTRWFGRMIEKPTPVDGETLVVSGMAVKRISFAEAISGSAC